MNAIPPRPQFEDAPAAGVVPVPPERLAESYARIVAGHEAEKRRERRRARGMSWLTGALAAANLALAGALAVALPLKEIRPVFVTMNADGTFATSISQHDLPPTLREATIASTLWLYVASRERYTWGSHRDDQGFVFVLSDKATGDAYEAEVSPRNPESPWRRHGNRTTVRVERISETLGCARGACMGADPDTYQVRFRRITRTEGQGERTVQVHAALTFRAVERIPAWQRVTGNPLGLQVVSYTTTEEGAGR